MSARLQSDVAVDAANQVMGICSRLKQLRIEITELTKVNSDLPFGTLWAALGTVAVNSDGTLGTADGTPNAAHPIDPSKYPGIARAVSSNDLSNALQIVVDEGAFLAGTAVGTNAARPAQLDTVTR